MENGAVYNETTEPQAKPPRRLFFCTLQHLWGWRLPAKLLQVVLSSLAVICEEIVEDCMRCSGLYFFEFTCCSAAFLSTLILLVYCTGLYEQFGEDKIQRVNFRTCVTSPFTSTNTTCIVISYMYKDGTQFTISMNFVAVTAIGAFFLLASIVFAATSTGSDVEKAACAFGFLASIVFLAEAAVESFHLWKERNKRSTENPGNTPCVAEGQPLNKHS